jgi:hypothetical protein
MRRIRLPPLRRLATEHERKSFLATAAAFAESGRGVGRIGGVEKLEEFDEFAAAMAIPDQGMDLAGKQVDAGQQAVLRALARIAVSTRKTTERQPGARRIRIQSGSFSILLNGTVDWRLAALRQRTQKTQEDSRTG